MENNTKIKNLEAKNYQILTFIMALFPIIDVINSIITRNFEISLSIGMVAKAGLILYLFYYFVFKVEKSNSKILFLCYIGALSVWFLLFFLNRFGLLSFGNIFNECIYIFKYYYSVIILILLYYFCKENKFDNEKIKRLLMISFFVYTALLFIPYITGTAYNSYKVGWNAGKVGWFYTANEVGALMLLLYFIAFGESIKSKKKYFIPILIGTFCILEIGTKITLIGIIFILAYYLLRYITKKKLKDILYIIIMIMFACITVYNGALSINMSSLFENLSTQKQENKEEQVVQTPTIPTPKPSPEEDKEDHSQEKDQTEEQEKIDDNLPYESKFDTIVSGRKGLFNITYSIYSKSSLFDKLVGLGFTNTKEINDPRIQKLIEIDFLDIFFYFGIIGFILFLMPYLFFAILVLEKIIKRKVFSWNIFGYIYMIGMTVGISMMAGHVFSAPAVSVFLAIYILLLYNETNVEVTKKEENQDKKGVKKNKKQIKKKV